MMKGRLRGVALGLGMAMVVAVPASAKPVNGAAGERGAMAVSCEFEDGTREVLISNGNGGAAGFVVDEEGAYTGETYWVVEAAGVGWPGEWLTPPDSDPVHSWSKSWGKRTGHGDPITCTARDVFTDEDGQTWTVFSTFMVTDGA